MDCSQPKLSLDEDKRLTTDHAPGFTRHLQKLHFVGFQSSSCLRRFQDVLYEKKKKEKKTSGCPP